MHDEERFKLLYGPYQPPAVGLGDELYCELRGWVKVASWSEALISWPRARKKGVRKNGTALGPLILCGDLVRAVQHESSVALQHWWGVSGTRVTEWREALGVEKMTIGSQRLFRDWSSEILTEKRLALARTNAASPSARLKASQTKQERESWQYKRVWTPEQDALLGTMSDRAAAQMVGCSVEAIGLRRRHLKIPVFADRYAHSVSKTVARSVFAEKIRTRRLELDLTQKVVAQRAQLDSSYYSEIEAGRRRMKPSSLTRLAKALECEPDDLINPEPDDTGGRAHHDAVEAPPQDA